MHAFVPAWTHELPDGLVAADDARYAAMMANDAKALAPFLADPLVYTHSDGQTDDKTAYLAQIDDGRLQYRRFVRQDLTCLLLGEQALLRGELQLEARFKGHDASLRIHYLAAWTRHNGTWQLVAWASTRLPAVIQ